MSRWTHNICDDCWDKRRPGYVPVRLRMQYREMETCCFCGELNRAGIFIREDPQVTQFCNHGKNHAA